MTTRSPLSSVARSTLPRSADAALPVAAGDGLAERATAPGAPCVAGVLQPVTMSPAASRAAAIRRLCLARIRKLWRERDIVGTFLWQVTREGRRGFVVAGAHAASRVRMVAILPHRSRRGARIVNTVVAT